jgi:signal transduction histidine kinase
MKSAKPHTLRLLHLEDSDLDHVLVLAHLQRGGLKVNATRVDSEAEFVAALRKPWDAIVSDYNLPGFSGLVALELLKASRRDLPFLIVSGEIGEETAVEAMRNGASDYLRKSNLARLVPALMHAVEACETRRARARADQELGESKQRLRELAQHLQASIEQERAAIAREIHDDVGGSLTALKFELAWIARHAEQREVVSHANSALESVSHAIESSQRIMHNLRPAILEQGLVAALQWITGRFEKRSGVTCALRTPPELSALAGGVLSLEISDNGVGLNNDALGKARSFGLRGLHERARTVGGWVDLSSGAGKGTTLIFSVPLQKAQRAVIEPVATSADADPSRWGDL